MSPKSRKKQAPRENRSKKTRPKPLKFSGEARVRLLIVFLLVLLTLAAYWRVFTLGFTTFDDPSYVTENHSVRAGITLESILWAFTTPHSANWHPMTWISHMADWQLYGPNPLGHHATNLLLHLINTLLLFLLLCRWTGWTWRSAFVAALFAIHPLHVESVAWVAERKDVLSTLFWLLTMWAYARYVELPSARRYMAALAFFALGLLSKPMLVTLPIVLVLVDLWPLGRVGRTLLSGSEATTASGTGQTRVSGLPWTKLIREKIPLFVLAAASCAVTFFVQRSFGATRSFDTFPLGVRAANAVVTCATYISKMFWPAKLSAFYPHPGSSLSPVIVVAAVAALLLVTVLALRAGRSRPYITVGWLWYLITLVPVIGLVQVGYQAMADRYTYVPFIGLFLVLAWGIPDLLRSRQAALALPAAAVILVLAVVTSYQVGTWKNGVTLFSNALAATSGNYIVRYFLADAYVEQGRRARGEELLRETIASKPDFAEAHHALGQLLAKRGRIDEAISEFRRAIALKPSLAEPENDLGTQLAQTGKVDEGIPHIKRALKLDPTYAAAHYNMADALTRRGDMDGALIEYREAVRIDPGLAEAQCGLGMGLMRRGDYAEAEPHIREALGIKPDLAEAHFALGVVLRGQGDLNAAISELTKAINLKPSLALAHASLSTASYDNRDYVTAWKELRLAERYGSKPAAGFLKALCAAMPEPRGSKR